MSDDREWVEAFLAGQREVLDEAREWIRRAAIPFRRRLAAEWDDVQQQALLELLEDLRKGRFQGSGSIRGYVSRTVVHSCIDRIRHHQRWRFSSADLLHIRPDPQATEREGYLALQAIARRLGTDCRRLFQMILEGLSYREMSERLGVRAGTLRARVLRCRERARGLRRGLAQGEAMQETRP